MFLGDYMKRLNTILFDLDGTLIDTNEIIIQSYEAAFSRWLPEVRMDRKTIIENIGPPLEEIFSRYTEDEKTVDKLFDTFLDFYRRNEHNLFYLYDGVAETLEVLKDEGYNLGVVTSKFESSAEPSIRHFGLDRIFKCFVTLDKVEHAKPHAEPVLKALDAFDDVEKAIMIGDNPSDIESGKNAGVLTAGVAWSIKGREILNEAGPDYMLETMEQLFDIIKKETGA